MFAAHTIRSSYLLVLCSFLLTACGAAGAAETRQQPIPTLLPEWRLIERPSHRFALALPETWWETDPYTIADRTRSAEIGTPEPTPRPSAAYALYAIDYQPPQGMPNGVGTTIAIRQLALPPKTTTQAYFDQFEAGARQEVAGRSNVRSSQRSVANTQAVEVRYDMDTVYPAATIRSTHIEYVLIRDEQVYHIHFATQPDYSSTYEPVFQTILATFRWLP